MISVVNGYICTCSCDVAKAKQGKDPHAPPGSPPGASNKTPGFAGQPATILDNALKDSLTSGAVTPTTGAPNSVAARPFVNRLV